MSEIKTSFKIVETTNPEKSTPWLFGIHQEKRTVYYEDVVNPSGYRNSLVCVVKTREIAEKLMAIFNESPFTTEWLNDRRNQLYNQERLRLTNPNGRTSFQIFSLSESKIRCEQDLYNGTDSSQILYQLMKDKQGKYSAKSPKEEVCRLWSDTYVPNVVEIWCKKNKCLIL